MTTVSYKPTQFGTRIQRVPVADISAPDAELAVLFALEEGGFLVAYEVGNTFTLYGWQSSGAANSPYEVAGDGGYWVAIGGRYSVLPQAEAAVLTSDATYTVLTSDRHIYVDATAGDRVVALPAAVGSNRMLSVKKVVHLTNLVTLDADGSDVIDGDATWVLTQLWEGVTIQDVAVGVWYVVR